MNVKQSNCRLGPLRRRKQQISQENAVRQQKREEDEFEFHRNMFPLFVLIHQIGQEVPDEAWDVARDHGVDVEGLTAEIAKLERPPKEYACGFPENLYAWFVANPKRAIQISRVIRANSFKYWWATRNFLIVLGFGYAKPPEYVSPYTCIDGDDYLFDWLENDDAACEKAAKALLALKEQEQCEVKKSEPTLADVNNRENKRFWKKSFRMVVFLVIAYAAIAGIILWKVATS